MPDYLRNIPSLSQQIADINPRDIQAFNNKMDGWYRNGNSLIGQIQGWGSMVLYITIFCLAVFCSVFGYDASFHKIPPPQPAVVRQYVDPANGDIYYSDNAGYYYNPRQQAEWDAQQRESDYYLSKYGVK